MSFAANVVDNRIEKHSLLVIKPRRKVTSWTLYSANVYYSSFDYGYVCRVSSTFGTYLTAAASIAAITNGTFYWDHDNDRLYIGSSTNPNSDGGRTAEYEIHIASDTFTGPRDPLDSASQVVDWVPALLNSPSTKQGSVQSLYGVVPLEQSGISISNNDGWMNRHLYDSSFRLCVVKSWVMANNRLEKGVTGADIQTTFFGYTGDSLTYSNNTVSLSAVDFFKILDNEFVELKRFDTTTFAGYSLDPQVSGAGQEWLVRRIRGYVQALRPVNVDYSQTPSTTENRIWITHEGATNLGNLTLTIDHTKPNTATRTYTIEKPRFGFNDYVRLQHSVGSSYTVQSTTIDLNNNFFDHASVVRTVTAGDTVLRPFIGRMTVVNRNTGQDQDFFYFDDFLTYTDATIGVSGFVFNDNFEAAKSGIPVPLDPYLIDLQVQVYGTTALPQYTDLTDVGETTDVGGVAAQAVSMLYELLIDAGIQPDMIDEASFASVGAGSHQLTFYIPRSFSDNVPPTFKEAIDLILGSMLWKLGYVVSGNDLKIGLTALAPVSGDSTYTADETQLSQFAFEQDYRDVYKTTRLIYRKRDVPVAGITQVAVFSEIDLASDLHFSTKTYEAEILQYVEAEAQETCDRLSYALSDRRGLMRMQLPVDFLSVPSIGTSFDVERELLPGFEFTPGTANTRQTALVELQKSAEVVNITLDDQKGIQDNSGSW